MKKPLYKAVENIDFQIASVKFVSDGDGHDYLIPSGLYDLFFMELDIAEETDEFEPFINLFDKYRIEGQNLEFYIKL